MKSPFDPKLKAAAEEIKVILRKYDCNASMLLVSPSHCEYLFHVDATWSVIKFEKAPPGQIGIRFRSKKDDFPSKDAQKFATDSTVHFLTSTLQWGRMVQKNMDQLLDQLRKHMQILYETWK